MTDFEQFLNTPGLPAVEPSRGMELTPDEEFRAAANLKHRDPFSRGVARGVDQLQATGYGALGMAGSALGLRGLRDWGYENYLRNQREAQLNPATVPDIRSISRGQGVGDTLKRAGTYAVEKVGELAPSMAEAMVTGLAGAAIGSAMAPGGGTVAGGIGGFFSKQSLKATMASLIKTQVAKGMTRRQAMRFALKEAMKKGTEGTLKSGQNYLVKNAMKSLGAKAGIMAGVAPIEAGGNWGELMERGIDAPWSSAVSGVLSASLELMGGNSRLVGKVFGDPGEAAFRAALKGGKLKTATYILSNAIRQGGEEAMQEAGQETISLLNTYMNDPNFQQLTDEDFWRVIEAGAAGAVGGLAGAGPTMMADAARAPMVRRALDDGGQVDMTGKAAPPEPMVPDTQVDQEVESAIDELLTEPVDLEPQLPTTVPGTGLMPGVGMTEPDYTLGNNVMSALERIRFAEPDIRAPEPRGLRASLTGPDRPQIGQLPTVPGTLTGPTMPPFPGPPRAPIQLTPEAPVWPPSAAQALFAQNAAQEPAQQPTVDTTPDVVPTTPDIPTGVHPMTWAQYDDMSHRDLQKLARRRRIKANGSRTAIRKRLALADEKKVTERAEKIMRKSQAIFNRHREKMPDPIMDYITENHGIAAGKWRWTELKSLLPRLARKGEGLTLDQYAQHLDMDIDDLYEYIANHRVQWTDPQAEMGWDVDIEDVKQAIREGRDAESEFIPTFMDEMKARDDAKAEAMADAAIAAGGSRIAGKPDADMDVDEFNADNDKPAREYDRVGAMALAVGDTFTVDGEKFEVTGEGEATLTVEDGRTIELEIAENDSLEIDKGSFKAVDGRPLGEAPAPAEADTTFAPPVAPEPLADGELVKVTTKEGMTLTGMIGSLVNTSSGDQRFDIISPSVDGINRSPNLYASEVSIERLGDVDAAEAWMDDERARLTGKPKAPKPTPKPPAPAPKPSGPTAGRPVLRLTRSQKAGPGVAGQKEAFNVGGRIATLRMLNEQVNAYPDETFDRLDPAQIDEVMDYLLRLQREQAKPPAAKPPAAESPAPPTPKPAREPWQMTEDEWETDRAQKIVEAAKKRLAAGRQLKVGTQLRVTPLSSPDHVRLSGKTVQTREGRGWVSLTNDQANSLGAQAGLKMPAFGDPGYSWFGQVGDAIEKGLDVPADVRKEYAAAEERLVPPDDDAYAKVRNESRMFLEATPKVKNPKGRAQLAQNVAHDRMQKLADRIKAEDIFADEAENEYQKIVDALDRAANRAKSKQQAQDDVLPGMGDADKDDIFEAGNAEAVNAEAAGQDVPATRPDTQTLDTPPAYGTDPTADLAALRGLSERMFAEADADKLAEINEEAAKIAAAWGKDGLEWSEDFRYWLEQKTLSPGDTPAGIVFGNRNGRVTAKKRRGKWYHTKGPNEGKEVRSRAAVNELNAAFNYYAEQMKRPPTKEAPVEAANEVVGEQQAQAEIGAGLEKSKGHVGWFEAPDSSQPIELYKDSDGNLYRAPASNVIDNDTGQRIGRWEAPPHMADKMAERLMGETELNRMDREAPQEPADAPVDEIVDEDDSTSISHLDDARTALEAAETPEQVQAVIDRIADKKAPWVKRFMPEAVEKGRLLQEVADEQKYAVDGDRERVEIRQFPTNAPRSAMRKIGNQYADAIVRRGREATDPDWLAEVWRENSSHFVRDGENFLILRQLADDVYVASHFAPASLRGGYQLLKKIAREQLPVLFTVPEDLAVNLERLGWKRIPQWANRIATNKGLPDGKVVLYPSGGGALRKAWTAIKSGSFSTPTTFEANNFRARRRGPGVGQAKLDSMRRGWIHATTMAEFFDNAVGEKPATGMTAESLRSALGKVADNVTVVDSIDDVPQGLVDPAVRDRIQAIWDGKSKRAYLIAGMLPDAATAARKLAHEMVGHAGIDGLLGENAANVFDQVFRDTGIRRLQSTIDRYFPKGTFDKANPKHRQTVAAEYIAQVAEQQRKPGWWQQVVSAVRAWLRKTFPGLSVKWTSGDIESLVARAAQETTRLGESGSVAYASRNTVTPEQDAEYLAAVKRGDTEAAQKMVDEAAKKAGYNVGPVWHGTPKGGFNEFSPDMHGTSTDHGYYGKGFYFTSDKALAKDYSERLMAGATPRVIGAILAMRNPFVVDWRTVKSSMETRARAEQAGVDFGLAGMAAYADTWQPKLMRAGYDGIMAYRDEGSQIEHVVFDPSQIKSADAVTYDDAGRVIPLSERFNEANEDIRYALADEATATEKQGYDEDENREYAGLMEPLQRLKRRSKEAFKGKWLEKAAGVVSTRIKKISPELKRLMYDMDSRLQSKDNDDLAKATPIFTEAVKRMPRKDYWAFDAATKFGDRPTIDRLVKEYGLEKELQQYREFMDNYIAELRDNGYEVGYIDDYFPRIVRDPIGLLEELKRRYGKTNEYSAIEEAWRKREKEMADGQRLSPEEKAEIASKMLQGFDQGKKIGLGPTDNMKRRTLNARMLTPDLMARFYHPSVVALTTYILQNNKRMAWRQLVLAHNPDLKASLQELRDLRKKYPELYEASLTAAADGKETKGMAKRLAEMERRIAELESETQALATVPPGQQDSLIAGSIGLLVTRLIEAGKMNARDEIELKDMLTAIYNERGPSGWIRTFRNLAYLDTLAQIGPAITQIGDLAWSLYRNGTWATARALGRAVARKSEITREQFVRELSEELRAGDSWTDQLLNKSLFMLRVIDKLGKETLANASIIKMREDIAAWKRGDERAGKRVKTRLKEVFGEDDWQAAMRDLEQQGELTWNVKRFAYDELARFQPIGPLEMPEYYLNAGNWQVVYMLKTFTIKQIDVYRNEIFGKYKEAIKNRDSQQALEATRNMARLAMYFALCGATADAIKDLLMGRPLKPDQIVGDSLLKVAGIGRWDIYQTKRFGLGTAIKNRILPPHKFIDSLSRDIFDPSDKGMRSISSIPLIGNLWFWQMGPGLELIQKDQKKERER